MLELPHFSVEVEMVKLAFFWISQNVSQHQSIQPAVKPLWIWSQYNVNSNGETATMNNVLFGCSCVSCVFVIYPLNDLHLLPDRLVTTHFSLQAYWRHNYVGKSGLNQYHQIQLLPRTAELSAIICQVEKYDVFLDKDILSNWVLATRVVCNRGCVKMCYYLWDVRSVHMFCI